MVYSVVRNLKLSAGLFKNRTESATPVCLDHKSTPIVFLLTVRRTAASESSPQHPVSQTPVPPQLSVWLGRNQILVAPDASLLFFNIRSGLAALRNQMSDLSTPVVDGVFEPYTYAQHVQVFDVLNARFSAGISNISYSAEALEWSMNKEMLNKRVYPSHSLSLFNLFS
ncbi:hypothetical protein T10_2834 [Trichinella papuae]|uniref:Uncharacterized protein n=1 Tax=Trichinella papuae TaxID=268474 RepID=A0A0V1M275_9BILA|nr:hypothetical protein T10_2834 [Trichinella papuae]